MKGLGVVFLVFSVTCPRWVYGQSNIQAITQTGVYLSTSPRTPYLNRINQYGVASLDAQTWFFNTSIHQKYDSSFTDNKKVKPWGYSYGIEVQANLGGRNALLVPIAHISGRYNGIELYVGRKKEYLGLADTTGTWGSYIWSGNALPLPKIQISTPNYISLVGKGFLSAKLGFSHGWFAKQQYTEKYYLHQKWLYIKLGRESQKVNFIGGVNQNAQWGGYSEELKNDAYASRDGHFASDAFAYLNVILPLKLWKRPDNRYSPYEMEYRFGNHLGTVDLGIRYKINKGTVSFYRQTPWEDGQAPEVFFSGDGNYTLTYTSDSPAYINKIGIEFLNTRTQALELSGFAKLVGLKEKHFNEFQNYLNHGQYLEGWSYNGRAIGSTAIIPLKELSNEVQNNSRPHFTSDNVVIAPALNLAGSVGNVNFSVRSGYIVSSGVLKNERADKCSQSVTRLSGTFLIPKTELFAKIDLGIDRGSLYGNQSGVNLTLIKKWR